MATKSAAGGGIAAAAKMAEPSSAAQQELLNLKAEVFATARVAYERLKSNDVVDFRSVCKVLWSLLDNNINLVDLCSLFTMVMPKGAHHMTLDKFCEFANGLGKIRYPHNEDFAERILVEIRRAKLPKISSGELDIVSKVFDRNTIKVLLMYDLPLKSIFCSYIGKKAARLKEIAGKQKDLDTKHDANTHKGAFSSGIVAVDHDSKEEGPLSWAEARAQGLGLEIEEFNMFAYAFDLIPKFLTVEQMCFFIKKTLDHFPLKASTRKDKDKDKDRDVQDQEIRPTATPGKVSTPLILFPHFQLLLCILAVNQDNMMTIHMTKDGRKIEMANGEEERNEEGWRMIKDAAWGANFFKRYLDVIIVKVERRKIH